MNLKLIKASWLRLMQSLRSGLALARRQRALELRWGAETLRFEGVSDFSFALGARTGVLPTRLHDLMARPAAELDDEVVGIRHLAQRIDSIIEANDTLHLPCMPAIAHLGVAVFSKDFEWRGLFAQLIEQAALQDEFARAALAKYQDYLRSRLSTVRLVMDMKARLPAVDGMADEIDDDFAKATMMFEANGELRPFSRDELHRLPQGEAVTLRLARGSAISLKLARHRFSLSHNRDWTLVADNGKSYVLHEGVNCVGRGRDNDISLDADFRNVSRKHLLAQPLDNDVILLTDISSHGTYVPPTALAS